MSQEMQIQTLNHSIKSAFAKAFKEDIDLIKKSHIKAGDIVRLKNTNRSYRVINIFSNKADKFEDEIWSVLLNEAGGECYWPICVLEVIPIA